MKNYWGYRIDKNRIKFFSEELKQGRLRQGWGYDSRQDLRKLELNEGASRNLPMFNKVKKGDLLLVPRIPSWGEVAIVEATEDWNKGYDFEIYEEYGDYGHIFPAKLLKSFTRQNQNVNASIRSSLRTPSRFWNLNYSGENIQKLLQVKDSKSSISDESRFENSIGEVFNDIFDESVFADKVYSKLNEQFEGTKWEYALVYGLRKLFPYYQIERVGGVTEKDHGADIIIKIPSILPSYTYIIAIQVKDYVDKVSDQVIKQINKSDNYWDDENTKLIDKIVIITKAHKNDNLHLEKNSSVKFIFANSLKEILAEIGKKQIGLNN